MSEYKCVKEIIEQDAFAWVQTYSGRKIDLVNPENNFYSIEDIAHSLSMLCRYNGHTKKFYSVAEHSVLVSENCEHQIEGLMHDASEAFTGDVARPLKRMAEMTGYRLIDDNIQRSIFKQFNLIWPIPDDVMRADYIVFVREALDLMSPFHPDWQLDVNVVLGVNFSINCWPPELAKQKFLERYVALINK